jgi:hypothetical protein
MVVIKHSNHDEFVTELRLDECGQKVNMKKKNRKGKKKNTLKQV